MHRRNHYREPASVPSTGHEPHRVLTGCGRLALGISLGQSGPRVSLDAPIGSFPIPHEAQVMVNMTCGKQLVIELTSVTPSQASDFYLSALPREGYKITGKTQLTETGNGQPGAVVEIDFTGHGYKGTIGAVANLGALSSTGPSPAACPATSPRTSSRSR